MKSGTLDIVEIQQLCRDMGLPMEKEEEEVLMKMDADGSGLIEMSEWVQWWLKRISNSPNPAKQQEAIARNTFKKFDIDGGGTLDASEIHKLLCTLGATFTDAEMIEVMKELGKYIYHINYQNRLYSAH